MNARCEAAVASLLVIVTAALFLSRVQAARADADRAQCRENLRQLGSGFLAFEKAEGGFPARRLKNPKSGWGAQLLPHVGQEALAKSYNFRYDWFDPANRAASETPIKTFTCPASPTDRKLICTDVASPASMNKDRTTRYSARGAPCDFVASNGFKMPTTGYGINWPLPTEADDNNQHQAMTDDAVLPVNTITVGLGCTILLIEQAGRPQLWMNGKRAPGGGDGEANGNARGLWAGYGAIPFHPVDRTDGTSPGTGGRRDCVVNCNNQHSVYGFHAAGAHVLLCDGSVRFVGEKLDVRIFALLVTRDDGEALGSGDY
jgi:hypothetical protein